MPDEDDQNDTDTDADLNDGPPYYCDACGAGPFGREIAVRAHLHSCPGE